jgi:hypothetical protein
MLHIVKPAALGAQRASVFVNWQVGGAEDSPSQVIQQAIRAELIGSNICTALGLIINSPSPVLALCRALVELGHDPAIPLEAYRGDVLCLRVRSIGGAAALEINSKGTGFIANRAVRAAPPMRQNRRGVS